MILVIAFIIVVHTFVVDTTVVLHKSGAEGVVFVVDVIFMAIKAENPLSELALSRHPFADYKDQIFPKLSTPHTKEEMIGCFTGHHQTVGQRGGRAEFSVQSNGRPKQLENIDYCRRCLADGKCRRNDKDNKCRTSMVANMMHELVVVTAKLENHQRVCANDEKYL